MPKFTKNDFTAASGSKSTLFVFIHNGERVLSKRESSYRSAEALCRTIFPEIPLKSRISFYTKELTECEGQMTRIHEGQWREVVQLLKSVTVQTTGMESVMESDLPKPLSRATPDLSSLVVQKRFQNSSYRYVEVSFDSICSCVKISPKATLNYLLERFVAEHSIDCPSDLRMIDNRFATRLDPNSTIEDAIDDGNGITIFRELKGGKPVVYLFSPETIQADVSLSLSPQWDFSAIYPVVPINQTENANYNQEVSWKVLVRPNGELTELTTSLDVAYLFWEAHTNPPIASSQSSVPSPEQLGKAIEAFEPSNAILNDTNSIIMRVEKITVYLDEALRGLGLHTEARTSFITYWLPSFLKHKYIAFRFLSQASYEQAAPLVVSPSPDVITRVFLIFQGVLEEELTKWPSALAKASLPDTVWWREVVGIDVKRALDKKLFRVLEWGGMEVLRS